jgi:hypothetical protein
MGMGWPVSGCPPLVGCMPGEVRRRRRGGVLREGVLAMMGMQVGHQEVEQQQQQRRKRKRQRRR